MQSFDQFFPRMFSQSDWGWKCLFGGILMAFPIVNFLAFGFLYRLLEESRRGGALTLPDWEDWSKLFIEGLCFFVIFAAYALLPLAVAYLLSCLPFISIFGPLAYIMLIPVMLFSPPLTAASLYCFQAKRRLRDAFEINRVLTMVQAGGQELVVPTLVFLGILLAGAPILPLAFFLGVCVVFHFYFRLFHELETRKPSTPLEPYTFL